MGFFQNGRYVAVPWGKQIDKSLSVLTDETYKYSGDDLLHEIHRQTIEAHWVNMILIQRIRTRLAIIIGLHAATLGYLIYRFGF